MLITFIFSLVDKLGALLKFIRELLYGSLGHTKEIRLSCKLSNGFSFTGISMTIIARIDQQVTFSPVFKDAAGNAVSELGSVPAWSLSDNTMATIDVSADGFQAVVTPNGHLGDLEVNMVIDADPDADVEEVVAKATITFKAGKAVFVTLAGTVADVVSATTVDTVTTTTTTTSAPVEQTTTEAPAVEHHSV